MKKIISVLNDDFLINKIDIENFSSLDKVLKVSIEINTKTFGIRTLSFMSVSNISIDREHYHSSERHSIVMQDVSEAQLEGMNFKIEISEDCMQFYCRDVILL